MATVFEAGLRRGSTGAGVSDVKAYLRRYGYLASAEAAERFGIRSFRGQQAWRLWGTISPPYTFFLLNGDMELNRKR
jgi:hypothetical protein